MSPGEARQHLVNGIAETMHGLSALANAAPDAFEARRAALVEVLFDLRGMLRTCDGDLEIDDARFGAALPHVTALIDALVLLQPGAPLARDVEQAFERFLAAVGSRPGPSLRELIAAYRTTSP